VVEELQGKGAIFVDSVDEVPAGERVIYSAHGAPWSPRSTWKP
jgi:4-hydroxy-3-methylbut-2-enyl diphosphate reductase